MVSTLCAGVAYVGWLALVLLTKDSASAVLRAALWLLAPVVTAAGFAAGSAFFERRDGPLLKRFARIFLWPLVACSVGAAVVCPFGPMLVVFGMFMAGATSIALREALAIRRARRGLT